MTHCDVVPATPTNGSLTGPGRRAAASALLPVSIVIVFACVRTAQPTPPAECPTVWTADDAAGLVSQLERATAADREIWGEYDIGDAAYVLNAGEADSGAAGMGRV